MIISLHELAPTAPLHADLCIVGAGAAGIAMAMQFAAANLDIILLESGGMRPDRVSQSLCAGQVAEPALHPPADMYRRRGLGGSTAIWGGRCAPLDPIDFEARPWLDLPSGWPLTYDELLPYWRHAARLAELGDFDFSAATAVPGGMRPMFDGFANAAVSTERIERFSPPTHFGRAYGNLLAESRHIQTLLHATCQQIVLTQDLRSVSHILVAMRSGKTVKLRARVFVLATGGVEVPRLLLASASQMTSGIGNTYGQVGRNYMCHLAGTLGIVTPGAGPAPFHGYERAAGGVYCRRRLSIEPWAQRALGIGNAVARLHHPRLADPSHGSAPMSGLYLGQALLAREYTRRLGAAPPGRLAGHLANVARDPAALCAFGLSMLRRRALAARKYPSVTLVPPSGAFTLDIHAEQLPNPASRITLTESRDRFGQCLPRIDWHYLPADIKTVRGTVSLIAGALDSGGHGTLAWDPRALEAEILRDGAYGGHHLGTARMASQPRHGVVDAECRVHGTDNLYIAGGAVFPTSGQANPTLTILALALRLADHIKARLMASPAQRFSVLDALVQRRGAMAAKT